VIKPARAFHSGEVGALNLSSEPVHALQTRAGAVAKDPTRLRALMNDHFDFIWRQVRRLGLPHDAADDATQQVFIIASRKLDEIARGRERSFLFGTAMRVASDARRAAARQRARVTDDAGDSPDRTPGADELLDRHRARAALDDILAGMELDLRAVFVLFELEEMTMADIATLLECPPGTIASRLRRARAQFQAAVKRRHSEGAR